MPRTDAPGKPSVPKIEDWDVDRVDLVWDAPKNNGGAPITGYVIEKKDKFGTWQEALTTTVSQISLYFFAKYGSTKKNWKVTK